MALLFITIDLAFTSLLDTFVNVFFPRNYYAKMYRIKECFNLPVPPRLRIHEYYECYELTGEIVLLNYCLFVVFVY